MKRFACGEVVAGCPATWDTESDEELLALVGRHVVLVHGIDPTPSVVEAVRSRIVVLA